MMIRRVLNTGCALAMSLSWLLFSGMPASAAVTGMRVETPKADAVLTEAVPLVVAVEWTAGPFDEDVAVRTRLVDPAGKVVGVEDETNPMDEGTVLYLEPVKPDDDDNNNSSEAPSDELRFEGVIDPYDLAWLGGGVAPNGTYHVQYQWEETTVDGPDEDDKPDSTQRGDWQSHRFTLDAAPAPQPPPVATAVKPGSKKVEVTWPLNAAPDVTSYTVERKAAGGEWKVVAKDLAPDTADIADKVKRYGGFRYRVTVARSAADPKAAPHTLVSTPSTKVKVAALEQDEEQEESERPEPLVDRDALANLPHLTPGPADSSTSGSVPGAIAAPPGANLTYEGPLDYGVEPRTVTERVPVDIAKGGAGSNDTLTVVDSDFDEQRVLPPLAGGLILIVSAAHVLRYLNE
jgi:hypothetical protein